MRDTIVTKSLIIYFFQFQTEVDDVVYINSIIVATMSVAGYMFVGTLINAMGKKNLIGKKPSYISKSEILYISLFFFQSVLLFWLVPWPLQITGQEVQLLHWHFRQYL